MAGVGQVAGLGQAGQTGAIKPLTALRTGFGPGISPKKYLPLVLRFPAGFTS